MPDVHDIALSLKNLRLEYRNSLAVTFEGVTFLASAPLILWIEQQLAVKSRNQNRAYDLEGYPVHVQDLKGLVKALRDRLTEADTKYLSASIQLKSQLVDAFTDLPPVPEHEE
jgi:hypothetical protein